ncbi:hypothetical protein KOR42_16010 [Thalassoglobus neptunius]|uniref:DUF5343 domain-containing protein n=1 Tax=Thalassoglobus neptunius TaxID=1938619 RepID=A0A5C5X5M4_9PLAN|nr:DUF5343 domain-containing protein [Thalassoglobus neptunius]TWT58230.1 hypothetical protein KOR42_16010 [Thalassoglobus neptunius]
MAKEKVGLKPPYCSFSTLKTFVENLRETAVPKQIDRSIMPKMSGVTQGQLLSALQFLGLTDSDGTTKDRLQELVDSQSADAWKAKIKEVINDSYGSVVGDLEISSASGKQLRDRFKNNSGIDGQILAKSLRFYISALSEAGVDYSPHFKDATKGLASGRSRSTKKQATPPVQGGNNGNGESGGEEVQEISEKETDIPGTIRLPIPFKNKPHGYIVAPEKLSKDDMKIVEIAVHMLSAYAVQEEVENDIE